MYKFNESELEVLNETISLYKEMWHDGCETIQSSNPAHNGLELSSIILVLENAVNKKQISSPLPQSFIVQGILENKFEIKVK